MVKYLFLMFIMFIACIWTVTWAFGMLTDESNVIYKENVKLAHVSPPVFEYAHAYHGVLSSRWSKKKKCYSFERDGKEYKLFTKAFWMWYIENYERKEDVDFFYEK